MQTIALQNIFKKKKLIELEGEIDKPLIIVGTSAPLFQQLIGILDRKSATNRSN